MQAQTNGFRRGGGIQSMNRRRPFEPICHVPLAEAEARYQDQAEVKALTA